MRRRNGIQPKAISGAAVLLCSMLEAHGASPICPVNTGTISQSGPTLQSFATNNASGVEWSTAGSALAVTKSGDVADTGSFILAGTPHEVCPGDFDGDTWEDFVSVTVDGRQITYWRNVSWDSVSPFNGGGSQSNGTHGANDDPAPMAGTARKPAFLPYVIENLSTGSDGSQAIGCGDMNGDGKTDFYILDTNSGETTNNAPVARAHMYLNQRTSTTFVPSGTTPGAAIFPVAGRYQLTQTAGSTGMQIFKGMRADSEAKSVDINGDGRLDIVLASSANGTAFSALAPCSNASNCGLVRAYFNNGASPPKFVEPTTTNGGLLLLTQLPTIVDSRGFNALDFADFNGDGLRDIVVAGVAAPDVRIHYGLAGGGFAPVPQLVTLPAAGVTLPAPHNNVKWNRSGAQNVFVTDANLDGKPDVVMATDSGRVTASQESRWFLWKNAGAPNYVGGPTAMTWSWGGTPSTTPVLPGGGGYLRIGGTYPGSGSTDADVGLVINYDKDPEGTKDFLVVNGNTSNAGYKVFAIIVSTIYANCGTVFSDPMTLGLSTTESVVTGARITPSWTLNGGTINIFASNEDPANWQLATLCPASATDYCVNFPKPSGQTVRWKAEMCSNATHTQTPLLHSIQAKVVYSPAAVNVRSGVVSSEGVAYVGAFRQPGERGHFYAMAVSMAEQFWDFGDRLNTQNTRKIFTTKVDGKTRLDFSAEEKNNPDFQGALGVANATDAGAVVDWWRGTRFGIHEDRRLGGVVRSTPAIVGPPGRPYYYNYVNQATRTEIDTFINAQKNRARLALVGSKDGSLHAVLTDPSSLTCMPLLPSGYEAWAFIPQRVASSFFSSILTDDPTSFVDGAITLADIKIGTAYRTIAIFGLGDGGHSFTALDVTDTLASTGGADGVCRNVTSVTGPTPLWSYVVNDTGLAKAKPVVIRTRIGSTTRFLAVLASGIDPTNATAPWSKGREVHAVDAITGALVWRFRAQCPVTTDLAAFETDDGGEAGSPKLDGFVDRVVFGDACGNVYKVAPNQSNPTGWLTSLGSFAAGTDPSGQAVYALFNVSGQAGIPAAETRPIYGTIAVQGESRKVLYFGTGGIESYDPTKANAFFAIYADDGSVRSTVSGSCTAAGCDKFYGGAVVTSEQVIAARAKDPLIAVTSCDKGSGEIFALDLLTMTVQFAIASSSAIQSALFLTQGALYSSDLSGKIIRIGTPTVSVPASEAGSSSPSFVATNWRQLL